MPTPCQKCGETFDLTDGYPSKKWYPNTVICVSCHDKEAFEIGYDEEVENLKEEIDELEDGISSCREAIKDYEEEIEQNIVTLSEKRRALEKLESEPISY